MLENISNYVPSSCNLFFNLFLLLAFKYNGICSFLKIHFEIRSQKQWENWFENKGKENISQFKHYRINVEYDTFRLKKLQSLKLSQ